MVIFILNRLEVETSGEISPVDVSLLESLLMFRFRVSQACSYDTMLASIKTNF